MTSELELPTMTARQHQIIQACCAEFGGSEDELMSRSRPRRVSDARAVAMWFLRRAGETRESIMHVMKRRSSTVGSSLKLVDDLIPENAEFASKVYRIMGRLDAHDGIDPYLQTR